jgi:hypothetical protein
VTDSLVGTPCQYTLCLQSTLTRAASDPDYPPCQYTLHHDAFCEGLHANYTSHQDAFREPPLSRAPCQYTKCTIPYFTTAASDADQPRPMPLHNNLRDPFATLQGAFLQLPKVTNKVCKVISSSWYAPVSALCKKPPQMIAYCHLHLHLYLPRGRMVVRVGRNYLQVFGLHLSLQSWVIFANKLHIPDQVSTQLWQGRDANAIRDVGHPGT